ncbi:MAG: FecR domain-containing protein [Saprospiraceae bacterium]|nr:FecR domain-containing protein [Saprospiraceae bacterium]
MFEKDSENLNDLLQNEEFRRWILEDDQTLSKSWNEWIAQKPGRDLLVLKASSLLKGIPFEFKREVHTPAILNEQWNKFESEIQKRNSGRKINGERKPSLRSPILRIAASVLILIAISISLQQLVLNPVIVQKTAYGQQLKIVLNDSSEITLNANSEVKYHKRNPRKIWLDGEAYFHVAKKKDKRNFLVITDDLTVEVLGTTFNVDKKEFSTEVTLEEGQVKLNLQKDTLTEVYMEPGDQITYSTRVDHRISKRQVEPENSTSWKDGILQFQNTPLVNVMNRIEEIYGWRTVYTNEDLQTRNISMPLSSNDLESAITLLSKAINITIEKVPEDKVLILY